ncbi:MAG: 16S rRNA (uracil(1498)-N(3))-methyltransferase [Coriobacteriales bacterium]|jgi:16S rRNA (uracil1498-N3)-methyltransferase|nr:16S rRNA (uracil(1498)-N(3))-methyltransferase [Coriobacteriales bacterium]
MSLPHFFIEQTIAGQPGDTVVLALSADVCDHMRSLRLRTGERVVLADAPRHGWELELTAMPDKKERSVEGVLVRELLGAPRPAVTLVQGISAADRMDQTIRQVTELGVSRVIPLESERSTVRLTAASRGAKHERWQRVARGAAEQSGQLELPLIEPPVELATALEMLSGYDTLLFFWEEPGGRSLAQALSGALADCAGARHSGLVPESIKTRHFALAAESSGEGQPSSPSSRLRVAVFVGPEGGFSADEAALIEAAGAQTVTLGDTILRTETAAVVACALTLYELGALGAAVANGAPHAL